MRERRLGSRSLTVSASFKEGKMARRGALVRPSLDADEFINLLHGSNLMKMDLNRLENEVRGLSNRNIGTVAYDIVQVPYYCGWGNVDGQIRKKTTSYATGTFSGCFLTGVSFYLKGQSLWLNLVPVLAVSGVLIHIAAFSIGMGAVPWVITSEIFPIYVKGATRSLVVLVNWVGAWAVSYTFNFMMEWSSTTTFMFYDMFCTLAVLFVAKEEASSRLLRSAIS
nr:sugar transporter ERD6-like 16 [Ipomoea batatas]